MDDLFRHSRQKAAVGVGDRGGGQGRDRGHNILVAQPTRLPLRLHLGPKGRAELLPPRRLGWRPHQVGMGQPGGQ